jgi:sulfite exporter TauE/SafE
MPVDLLVLGAAALAGLFGGVHCLAMCGGLATTLAIPGTGRDRLRDALLLNLGRVGGYTVAGIVVGGFGAALLGVVRLPMLAPTLRALVGLVMLLVAARLAFPRRLGWLSRTAGVAWSWIRPWRDRCVPAAGPFRPLVAGIFWGWLPCGLSTTMLAAAWLEASALHGGLLMLAFGLGTLPLMSLLSWSGAHFAPRLAEPKWRLLAAALIAMAGALTLAAPWLMPHSAANSLLQALGCRALPAG